ncbi:hypothetical protein V495_05884 [Pseudogymnoascus sp. VKM F-4514 (FW-929)]|nr:hypothetical protein V495_05884 [Pseudogymnoascus sp. VKM F-4514 (FW-929)]
MTGIHGCTRRAEGVQSPHDHVGVLVAVEGGGWGYDAVVYVALVVEDGAASGAAADKGDGIFGGGWKRVAEEREVGFYPGVLVAAYDYAGAVGIEEEDGGGWGR